MEWHFLERFILKQLKYKKMKKLLTVLLLSISTLGFAQSNEPIKISIPDLVINQTKIKRKAELHTMIYNQASKSLVLNWKVSYYADSSGHFGQPININGISSYSKESIANNTVFVNPSTGAFVAEGTPGAIGQYDFFYYLAENQDINVHDLIRAYGAAVTEW
jgi:hypothetical protein